LGYRLSAPSIHSSNSHRNKKNLVIKKEFIGSFYRNKKSLGVSQGFFDVAYELLMTQNI
jgi:hypothetical protein